MIKKWPWSKTSKGPAPRIYVSAPRTPEQEAQYQEQLRIRDELGFERGNDTQNWLRMHQILLDHENRLTDLETRNGK